MGDTLRRRVIVVLLVLGAAFATGLVWVLTLPPPVPGWEREALASRARELADGDDPLAAADAYRKALLVDPTLENRKELARALLRANRPSEAREVLGAVGAEEADEEAVWLESRVWLQAGDLARAIQTMAGAANYRRSHPIEPEPAPYVGAARCVNCHKGIHQVQITTAHARTYFRAEDLGELELPSGSVTDEFNPNVTHEWVREGQSIALRTRVGDDLVEAVVHYAFGSGDRGLTLVGKDRAGGDRELRLSRYAEPHGWQVTSGQSGTPDVRADYVGRTLSPEDLRGCFACHTTRPDAAIANAGPTASDRSIGCERCHGPGGNHLLAVEAKLPDLAIARPRHEPGGQVQELCAGCHSPKRTSGGGADPLENVMARATNDEVRFQSLTLPRSRCVTMSQGELDCLTCHEAHHDAEKEPAFYESKCLECHAAIGPGSNTACPVNPLKGCVNCHMPAVRSAVPHSTFTDHHIRIHPESEAPPLLRPPTP